jgi:hypothetical protein
MRTIVFKQRCCSDPKILDPQIVNENRRQRHGKTEGTEQCE